MSSSIGPQIPEILKAKFFSESEGQEKEQLEADIGSKSELNNTSNELAERKFSHIIGPEVSLKDSVIGDSDDPDVYMPALPPDMLAERQEKKNRASEGKKNQTNKTTKTTSRRILGPAVMPPPGYQPYKGEEEEEIIGPVLPEGLTDNLNQELDLQRRLEEFEERSERMRQALRPDLSDSEGILQRGEWMLVPPSRFLAAESLNKLRSRKFNKKDYDPTKVDNSLWTETPSERQNRLKDQKASIGEKKPQKEEEEEEPIQYTAEELEISERVHEYNEKYRPKSLLKQHSETYAKSKKWEQDDVRQRPFDRDRDVLGPRRMNPRKRKEILELASGLGSKFGHGRSGTFL
ncbi:hypothetical protein G9A89_008494 [Geosiphon pyriformis]|nr:hypothetical protein G9A89_008494 [Geosiphon pyriformis]